MDQAGNLIAAFALVIVLAVLCISIHRFYQAGECGLFLQPTWRRDERPIPYRLCMAFHVGLAMTLIVLLTLGGWDALTPQ